MSHQIYTDIFTASTYDPETKEICCPNCGSWTDIGDVIQDEFTGVSHCSNCKEA